MAAPNNSSPVISVFTGDITSLKVDAIVNATNPWLLGREECNLSGVDAARHLAAGSGLQEECNRLGCCRTGQAKITNGYNLPAKYVIHAVGPVYEREENDMPFWLSLCFYNALLCADEYGLRSIAFPSSGFGSYAFQVHKTADIAVRVVSGFLKEETSVQEIIFCCLTQHHLEVYRKACNKIWPETKT